MGRKRQWSIETIQQFLDESNSGCKLLTTKIIRMKDDMEFQCKCGNKFHRKFSNVYHQNGFYCQECSKEIIRDRMLLSHDEYLNNLKIKNITTIIPLEKYSCIKNGIKLTWMYYKDYIKEFDESTLTPYGVGA